MVLTHKQYALVKEWIKDTKFRNQLSDIEHARLKDYFFSAECRTGEDYTSYRHLLLTIRSQYINYIKIKNQL